MKNITLFLALLLFVFLPASAYNSKKKAAPQNFILDSNPRDKTNKSFVKIDSVVISRFFRRYPNVIKHKSDLTTFYKKKNFTSIWLNHNGIIDFAQLLYSKVNQIPDEGLPLGFAYKDQVAMIFDKKLSATLNLTETELLLSVMYIYYVQKVYKGIGTEKLREIGWLLPTKKLSYLDLLQALLSNHLLLDRNESQFFEQYYKLREVLKKYQQIQQNGQWNTIVQEPTIWEYKPGDTSKTITQIRHRLTTTGDLEYNSESNLYDEELIKGMLNFKKRHGYKQDNSITSSHIQRMNIPIENYIKTIIVNMERCRWIAPEITKAKQYIFINIPSYKLLYKRDGKTELESNVFVGGTMNETVIFSSAISHLVFSPYWNIPTSIVESEIKTALKRDKNYLVTNEMEWTKKGLRQKPGFKNPLGKVKFMFPSASNIYLHDSPLRNLFESEYRAYSHGCINMNKAQELTYLILKDNPDWPVDSINKAMTSGKETTCILKNKIPIHIAYFTAWVNDLDEISFFIDVYQRDERVASLLMADDIP